MGLLGLEHSKFAYRVDFALYGGVVVALAALLVLAVPRARGVEIASLTVLGLVSWTLIEYLMHRLVLHGLRPFSTWHAEHHRRPTALIYAPTIVSAGAIALLVFTPAWLLSDIWRACAVTLGVLIGYLAYAVTHHATHHWSPTNAWARRRKRWHAMHHGSLARPGYYGVTSGFWDAVFITRPNICLPDGERGANGRPEQR